MKVRTWHLEAAAEAALYAAAVRLQQGTLAHPALAMAAALWCLGRVASISDRQAEELRTSGLDLKVRAHAVECAGMTGYYARATSALFLVWAALMATMWGFHPWLTAANLAWQAAYPWWRRLYRRLSPRDLRWRRLVQDRTADRMAAATHAELAEALRAMREDPDFGQDEVVRALLLEASDRLRGRRPAR